MGLSRRVVPGVADSVELDSRGGCADRPSRVRARASPGSVAPGSAPDRRKASAAAVRAPPERYFGRSAVAWARAIPSRACTSFSITSVEPGRRAVTAVDEDAAQAASALGEEPVPTGHRVAARPRSAAPERPRGGRARHGLFLSRRCSGPPRRPRTPRVRSPLPSSSTRTRLDRPGVEHSSAFSRTAPKAPSLTV